MKLNINNLIYISLSINALLFFWILFLQFSIRSLKKRQKKLFQGKTAQDLESIIINHQNEIINLNEQIKKLFSSNEVLTAVSQISLSKVGMVRFNPFKNLGGNQSFSVAFLNNYNNGLVLSSLYSNEGSRFYAKTITNGHSQKKFPLTEEEKQAIKIAIGKG